MTVDSGCSGLYKCVAGKSGIFLSLKNNTINATIKVDKIPVSSGLLKTRCPCFDFRNNLYTGFTIRPSTNYKYQKARWFYFRFGVP